MSAKTKLKVPAEFKVDVPLLDENGVTTTYAAHSLHCQCGQASFALIKVKGKDLTFLVCLSCEQFYSACQLPDKDGQQTRSE